MNFGIIGDVIDHEFEYDPTDLIELGKALREAFAPVVSLFEDLLSLIEECGHLLYCEPTPPKEYARTRSRSRRDLYRHCEGGMYGYIYVAPKNLPYMRRPG